MSRELLSETLVKAIRVSCAYSIEHIREALNRMEHFLNKFK
ncbi:MAG: hypothetical protein ACLVJ6_08730 [Merdibacter sp.]